MSIVSNIVRPIVSSIVKPIVSVSVLPNPIFYMPLTTDLSIPIGTGPATLTRSTIGTYIDPVDDLLKTAVIDAARFESGGVLVEGSSANLLEESETFGATNWPRVRSSVALNTQVSPDGTVNASSLTGTDTTFGAWVTNFSSTSVSKHTLSVYAKSGTNNNFRLNVNDGSDKYAIFDLDSGTISAEVNAEAFVQPLVNSWYRLPVVADVVAASTQSQLRFGSSVVSASDTINIFGSQLEPLPFASSYIKATTSSSVRALDDLSVSAINIPAPSADYSVRVKFDVLGLDPTKNQVVYNVDGETSRKIVVNTTTGLIEATHGAVTSTSTAAVTPGQEIEVIFTVGAANQTLYINKVQEAQGAKGTVTGTATRISLGNAAGVDQLFGHLNTTEFYDVELTPGQVAIA